MPRPRLQREPCDCLDCGDGPPLPTGAAAAAACQDPPPKSLVLCLTGVLQPGASLQESQLPHLNAAVRDGWAGLLACRSGSQSLPQQLLGLQAPGAPPPLGRLPDRFKQLRAVLLTDSAELAQAGSLAGCYAVHQLGSSSGGWQPAVQLAARICKLLQVRPWAPAGTAVPAAAAVAPALAAVLAAAGQPGSGAGAEDGDEGDDVIDQLLVMLDAANAPGGVDSDGGSNGADGDCSGSINGATDRTHSGSSSSSMAALEWADSLLNQLNRQPGFRDTVLLTLVVGAGQQALNQQPLLAQEQALLAHGTGPGQWRGSDAAAAGSLRVQRPLQSYQFSGQERVEVDDLRPAIVVHRLAGVIRVDTASVLDLADIQARGAAGCILAERLLPEVAYKLGRAPKYGA